MTDAEKLRQTMYGAALSLAGLVGLPQDPLGEIEPAASIHEFDPAKRADVRIDRDGLDEVTWRGAVMALDFLMLSLAVTEPV